MSDHSDPAGRDTVSPRPSDLSSWRPDRIDAEQVRPILPQLIDSLEPFAQPQVAEARSYEPPLSDGHWRSLP